MTMLDDFKDWLSKQDNPSVLELGTRRISQSSLHNYWAPEAKWIGSDIEPGEDVDIVADAHELTKTFGENKFHAVVACSVYEHIARPWIASEEIYGVLLPGGKVYIQTHFAFPIHGHRNDYWRFTTEALSLLFEDAGFDDVRAAYEFPCTIESEQDPNTKIGQAFLNTVLVATRLP